MSHFIEDLGFEFLWRRSGFMPWMTFVDLVLDDVFFRVVAKNVTGCASLLVAMSVMVSDFAWEPHWLVVENSIALPFSNF